MDPLSRLQSSVPVGLHVRGSQWDATKMTFRMRISWCTGNLQNLLEKQEVDHVEGGATDAGENMGQKAHLLCNNQPL